jgi:hypothetical protein
MKSGIGFVLIAIVLVGIFSSGLALAEDKKCPAGGDDGYVSIFNGKDLTGWDGLEFWSAKDGMIRGETTKEKPTKGNTFLIYRGGKKKGMLKNFALKLKFRIQNGNSGVQFRSFVKDPAKDKYRVSGYQAEVQNKAGKVGFLYDEARRGWLVSVGDIMEVTKDAKKEVVGKVSDVKKLKADKYYTDKEWN